jgi:Ca-activated chloride channel family protein
MKTDPHDNENQLIDALLQEQARNDREQEILAIGAALKQETSTASKGKTKHRGAWLAGIAACAILTAGLYHQHFSTKDIVAFHETKVANPSADPLAQMEGSTVIKKNLSIPQLPEEKVEAITSDMISLPATTVPQSPKKKVDSLGDYDEAIAADAPHLPQRAASKDAKTVTSVMPASPAQPLPQEQFAPMTESNLAALNKSVPSLKTAGAGTGGGRGRGAGNGSGSAVRGNSSPAADGRRDFSDIVDASRLERHRLPTDAEPSKQAERYAVAVDPAWKNPRDEALSTFSVDVDNASYSNIRRMIEEKQSVPADAVRIEECINAFDYGYAAPTNEDAFAVHQSLSTCPWNEKNALLRIGIKGKEIPQHQRPASNLVFLIDVSGSMQTPNKLPLVKASLKLLLGRLDERDSVSYVVYAGTEGVVLPPTTLNEEGRTKAIKALDKLEAGGSTNGGAGIKRAYAIAAEQFLKGGTNRVILCSDGDFNVGVTGTGELVSLVKTKASSNIYLSVLSFGTGNLNDEMLEAIARDGNGNHYYIDSLNEAHNVFLKKLSGTLITIAKDVKLQLEFNPARVASYRLIGYANRQLRNQDFHDDRVDAGDIGAGHEVTAFYEIVPAGAAPEKTAPVLKYQAQPQVQVPAAPVSDHANEWLTLKLRHKQPEGDQSALQEHALRGDVQAFAETDKDFRFATAVAMFGMMLRHDSNLGSVVNWDTVRQLASDGLGPKPDEGKTAFLDLLRKLPK